MQAQYPGFGRDAYAQVIEDITESQKNLIHTENRNAELGENHQQYSRGAFASTGSEAPMIFLYNDKPGSPERHRQSEEEFRSQPEVLAEHCTRRQTAIHVTRCEAPDRIANGKLHVPPAQNEHERYRYLHLKGAPLREPGGRSRVACPTDVKPSKRSGAGAAGLLKCATSSRSSANLLVWEYDVPGHRIAYLPIDPLEAAGYSNVIERSGIPSPEYRSE